MIKIDPDITAVGPSLPAEPPKKRVNQVRRNLPIRMRTERYLLTFLRGSGSL
jgi:hypothetical protein